MIGQLPYLPSRLRSQLADRHGEPVTGGCSGTRIFRLTRAGETSLYLKLAPREPDGELRVEVERLRWLAGRLPVPEVRAFEVDDGFDYLLICEVPGVDASDRVHAGDLPLLVRCLAAGLRMLHALPVSGCPFDHTLDRMIPAAEERVRRGIVDDSDFDTPRLGRAAADLFQELLRARPAAEDLVFTHGDHCLPNVLLQHGVVSGFVDLGRAGVSDRYRDLALAQRSLAHNFGDLGDWTALLFQEYGIMDPDWQQIEYYQLLDEFF